MTKINTNYPDNDGITSEGGSSNIGGSCQGIVGGGDGGR